MRATHQVTIRPSLIPGGGRGLFAYQQPRNPNSTLVFETDWFPLAHSSVGSSPGQKIIEYFGDSVTAAQFTQWYGPSNNRPYVVSPNRQVYFDAACQRSAAAMANTGHNPHTNRASRRFCNADIRLRHGGQLWLVAIKPIHHGERNPPFCVWTPPAPDEILVHCPHGASPPYYCTVPPQQPLPSG